MDRTVVITLPDLGWRLLRLEDVGGGVSWVLSEQASGCVHGHGLAVPECPTTAELNRAMLPHCGRPVAETLSERAARRLRRTDLADGGARDESPTAHAGWHRRSTDR